MQELTYFNGEFVEPGAKVISIDDRGYLFGDPCIRSCARRKGKLLSHCPYPPRPFISLLREMDIPVKNDS